MFKPYKDAGSKLCPDARSRHNMMRMVTSFSSVATLCQLSGEALQGQGEKRCSSLLENFDSE